jgi:hypothetical protein
MPVNGHPFSSRTVFAPSQDGPSHTRRISVTASSEPSAVRPEGLPAARALTQSTPSLSVASSVDGERPRDGGWQDKGALGSAPPALPQPAPGTEHARRSVSDTGSAHSPDNIDALRRSARLTLRVRPGVKTALKRLADEDEISLSETAATGLEVFARAKIHEQEETLFEPRMRSMLRREVRASDNRHVPFEIKNAVAAEQTRILTTDLYKRQLLKEGVPINEINKKLDAAYNMARSNVLNTRTPKFKNLVAAYWQTTEKEAADRKDQSGEGTLAGEAGTGKPRE